MIEKIKQNILSIKKHPKPEAELNYDVIHFFKEVLTSDITVKKDTLHYIFNELLGNEVTDWLKKRSIKEFGYYPDFVDWYNETMIYNHIGKDTYVKTTVAISFQFSQTLGMRVINKNLVKLSKDDFLSQVLSPLINEKSKGIHSRYTDLYDYYMNKYVDKKDTFKELQKFSINVQVQLIDKLIKNEWFDYDTYIYLQKEIKNIDSGHRNTILSSVFKYESNVKYLDIFKKDFILIILNKNIHSDAFFKGVSGTTEKIDYIFKNLITDNKDYNKALDNNLSSKTNSSDKTEFIIFLNNILKAHFTGEKTLNETQFLLLFKKCYDSGQKQQITHMMDSIHEKSPELFKNIKNSLRAITTLEIYENKTLDFSKKEINKFILNLLHNYLLKDFENENKPTKKIKI